jgi:hypothetical protein
MASPYDPILRAEGIQAINGPASLNAILLDTITSVPFEGIWVPWLFVKQGSLEISGTFATLSCQLYGTNALSPLNSFVVTVTGSGTLNDVSTLLFTLPTVVVPIAYTSVGADTPTVIATALVASINANASLLALGFRATNLAGVITVTWPSPSPFFGPGAATTSSPGVAPVLLLTSSVTGSATEIFAIAAGVGGSALGTAITALGMTQFTFSARWLKIRITTLTGGNVTAIAQGTA